ncbi:hypothetical protein Deipr_2464 (plasmid) [Deinococcus proteolyticus MRP]|uniref:Uncharacterized protein n=1 Tax=Deinococcus proteolyticus (strain ATCC 35074 / DSM 20540 / JCM 6276 / NBRC 101906 / NCIMB 13154 / VKM Ac-1939 / CCM 2703 / MRP) TaxID=693977 RepID=F0RQM2_DEIPM|nr:hypothetical protein [Deinococcus proteolyticus]ADY27581.1 hypothetical protein Deipr_2464 [Deinococcus proteolyticus MRP]
MPTPPPVPDTPEALAIKRFLYNNFWPLSALVMKNPNPPKKPLTPEEKRERAGNIGMTVLTIISLPFAFLLGGGNSHRRGHPDTRSTEEKDFERHGVHGQHYWEPYLDPHGNAK